VTETRELAFAAMIRELVLATPARSFNDHAGYCPELSEEKFREK
jgi:hypothetical protein